MFVIVDLRTSFRVLPVWRARSGLSFWSRFLQRCQRYFWFGFVVVYCKLCLLRGTKLRASPVEGWLCFVCWVLCCFFCGCLACSRHPSTCPPFGRLGSVFAWRAVWWLLALRLDCVGALFAFLWVEMCEYDVCRGCS